MKIIKLTESDLTNIVKRVIKENEGKTDPKIFKYLTDNFTPDGGWDNDKYEEGFGNGEANYYYINGRLAFAYVSTVEEHNEDPYSVLYVGPKMYETLDEMFGKNKWVDVLTVWFEINSTLNVDDLEKDDFRGILSDYVDPSWRDDIDWDF
jgi:hypothetical protein